MARVCEVEGCKEELRSGAARDRGTCFPHRHYDLVKHRLEVEAGMDTQAFKPTHFTCVVEGHGLVPMGLVCQKCAVKPVFDSSEEGRKNGKVRVELVMQGMPNAIMEIARCMTWAIEGKGYSEGDFLKVPDATSKYRGAMYRHDLKEMMGQPTDDESHLLHAVHVAWNALARLEILLREKP